MAQVEIVLPKMGESVTEATIVEWLVNEGDQVEEDDFIVARGTRKPPCKRRRRERREF